MLRMVLAAFLCDVIARSLSLTDEIVLSSQLNVFDLQLPPIYSCSDPHSMMEGISWCDSNDDKFRVFY